MIMNIMLATLLMANSVDYQEVRVAIVLYAIAQVLRQSANQGYHKICTGGQARQDLLQLIIFILAGVRNIALLFI